MNKRLSLVVGLAASLGVWSGCGPSAPAPGGAKVGGTPPTKGASLAGDLSLAPASASKSSAPTILPLTDIPDPATFTIKELRETRPDGSTVVRQVKQFSGGSTVNHGSYAERRPDGAKYCEGRCADGLRTGPWTFWHTSGQVAKTGSYRQGKPEGTWTIFGENGSKERIEIYSDGKREGTWLFYHPNGKLAKQEEYQAGKRHGTWIEWYPDGKKQVENRLSDDELDGVQMLWHRNGRPLRQTEFKKGRRDGHFIAWSEQGEKLSELVYRNDVLVRSIE